MTLQAKRRRSRLIIATGVLISLVVAATIFVVLQSGPSTGAVATTNVVVAARDIPARKPIEDGDLAMRAVPVDETNEFAYTQITDVVGRITAVSVPAGQMVSPHLLASEDPNEGFEVGTPGAPEDPDAPATRAVSVMVPAERAVAGTIQPGHRVDVIATVPIAPANFAGVDFANGPSTKVLLQNVTVLSRDADLYILHVDLGMAEEVAEVIAASGTFSLALRPDGDDRTATTDGSTLDQLIDEYGFRFPRAHDPDGAAGPSAQTSP